MALEFQFDTKTPTLPVDAYYDTPVWAKMENEETGEEKRALCFPLTRYQNVMGRPRLISVNNIDSVGVSDFMFMATNEIEVPDSIIAAKTGIIW